MNRLLPLLRVRRRSNAPAVAPWWAACLLFELQAAQCRVRPYASVKAETRRFAGRTPSKQAAGPAPSSLIIPTLKPSEHCPICVLCCFTKPAPYRRRNARSAALRVSSRRISLRLLDSEAWTTLRLGPSGLESGADSSAIPRSENGRLLTYIKTVSIKPGNAFSVREHFRIRKPCAGT